MSTLDVEDLLRRTYADVAARTVAAPPGDATIVPLAGRTPVRRRRMWLAAAAVTVVVAGAVAALGRTGSDGAAGIDPDRLVHVLPGSLPGPERGLAVGSDPRLPLVRLERSAERDVIEYAGDGDRLRIQVDRGDAVRPVEDPDTEFDGVPARLDAETGVRRITWNPRPDMRVTVDWDRGDVPTLLELADRLIFVDEDAWRQATDHAGFGPYVNASPSTGVVATYRLGTTVPLTVEIQGWIHSGYSVRFPASSVSVPNIDQQCTASTGLLAGGPPGRVAVVADTAGTATVRRATDGSVVTVVEISELIPGTDNYVEVVDLDDPGETTWGCEVTR